MSLYPFTQKQKDKEFQAAMYADKYAQVKQALERGANPNVAYREDREYPNFLFYMVLRANCYKTSEWDELVALGIQKGADASVLNNNKRSLLTYALTRERYDGDACKVTEKIFTLFPDQLNDFGAQGLTPLMQALHFGDKAFDLCDKMISAGGAQHLVSKKNETLLKIALKSRARPYLIEKILKLKGDINLVAEDGCAAIHEAAKTGDSASIIKMLQDTSLNVNLRVAGQGNGDGAIHMAAGAGNVEMINVLMSAPEFKLDLLNNKKWTAVHAAVGGGHTETLKFLISKGMLFTIADKNDHTPLDIAISYRFLEITKTLLAAAREKNIAVDLNDCMFKARKAKSLDMVKLFINEGADPMARNEKKETLILAEMEKPSEMTLELIRLLVNAGCDIHAKDEMGKTAYDYAVDLKNVDLILAIDKYRQQAQVAAVFSDASQRFKRYGNHILDINEENGLTYTFNFQMKQVICTNRNAPSAPPHVQNFRDVEGQDAILEARQKLVDLGGTPSELLPAPGHRLAVKTVTSSAR